MGRHSAAIFNDAPTLLSTMDLSRYLAVSHTTIKKWADQEELPEPHIMMGRRYWQKPVIDKWLEQNKQRYARRLKRDDP